MHLNMLKYKGCHTIGSLFLFIFFLLFLGGCAPTPGEGKLNLHQAWFTKKFVTASGMEMGSYNYRVVRFYENGTYTMFGAGGFDAGKWFHSPKKATITLEPDKGNLDQLTAWWKYEATGDRMSALLYRNAGMIPGRQEGTYELEGFGNKGKEDPFALSMHQWQIKPAKAESLSEIKNRVLDYLSFLESLYKYMMANDVSSISTHWFPEPMKMNYSNGVRMSYADELESWNECFYDSTQAVKGYQYLSGAMRSVKLKEVENRFERNLDCVEQLVHTIKTTEILKED
jgi:hypothetical protein